MFFYGIFCHRFFLLFRLSEETTLIYAFMHLYTFLYGGKILSAVEKADGINRRLFQNKI